MNASPVQWWAQSYTTWLQGALIWSWNTRHFPSMLFPNMQKWDFASQTL
jgi:hypothetical protein